MGKEQSKQQEEIIIAQNAGGGGANDAQASGGVENIKFHLGVINLILGLALLLCCCGGCLLVYNLYKKCHVQMIRREINHDAVQRVTFRRKEDNGDV